MNTCPYCGGGVTFCEYISSAGVRLISACCGIPQEFITHREAWAKAAPEELASAIEIRRNEYEVMDQEARRQTRDYLASIARWRENYIRAMPKSKGGFIP
jgi:hypothetical protein